MAQTGKIIVGEILEIKRNCACGYTTEPFGGTCPECHTKVLDVILIADPENEIDGVFEYNEEGVLVLYID